ncbi:CAP domain-containing protein [Methyloligella solikamskensis]|uniref:CAP domain-containing protein n=1 Tax=Methyloligella solikamskensis TaxID=1177756 RepID=A0ABW3J7B9_9HYPH
MIYLRLFSRSLLIALCAAGVISACTDAPPVREVRAGTALEKAPALDPAQARDAINVYRKAKGLKPLAVSAKLNKAAMVQAEDIAKRGRLDHNGSDGSTAGDRVKRAGYDSALTAENIAAGQRSFEEVFQGWKKSPAHNRNLLLADAKDMGIAVAFAPNSGFKVFWALVLAAPPSAETRSNWE